MFFRAESHVDVEKSILRSAECYAKMICIAIKLIDIGFECYYGGFLL